MSVDAFSYLSVLLSIILGLAITQVLQGYRALLLSSASVRLYAPTILWSGLLLVFSAQLWWASFGLADQRDWTFAKFAIILLQTILLYMMSAIVLPDVRRGEAIDLKAHYYREVAPFFVTSLLMLAVSVTKDWMLQHQLPEATNLAFHAVFAGVSIAALAIRRPRVHEAIAIAMVAFVIAYIAILFARLSG